LGTKKKEIGQLMVSISNKLVPKEKKLIEEYDFEKHGSLVDVHLPDWYEILEQYWVDIGRSLVIITLNRKTNQKEYLLFEPSLSDFEYELLERIHEDLRDVLILSIDEIKKDRHVWSFENGLLDARPNVETHSFTFYEYTSKEFHELDPNLVDAYVNLGFANLQKEEYEEAVKWFSKVVEREKNNPEAYGNLGYVYMKMERLGAAKEMYERVLQLRSGDLEAVMSLAHIADLQGDYHGAVKQYQKAIGDPHQSLRQMDSLVRFLSNEVKRLNTLAEEIPPSDPLRKIMTELGVVSAVEIEKFNRGEYV
jgi:tetratricopeptide (TPR) repeat protein